MGHAAFDFVDWLLHPSELKPLKKNNSKVAEFLTGSWRFGGVLGVVVIDKSITKSYQA
jgi:hypothetical protein